MEQKISAKEVHEAVGVLDTLAKGRLTGTSAMAKVNVSEIEDLLKNPKLFTIFGHVKNLIEEIQSILAEKNGDIKLPKAINLIKYIRIGKSVFTFALDIIKDIIELKKSVTKS